MRILHVVPLIPRESLSQDRIENLVNNLHNNLIARGVEYPIKDAMEKYFSDLESLEKLFNDGKLLDYMDNYDDYISYTFFAQDAHRVQNTINTLYSVVLSTCIADLEKAFLDNLERINKWYSEKKVINNNVALPLDAIEHTYNKVLRRKYGYLLKPELN